MSDESKKDGRRGSPWLETEPSLSFPAPTGLAQELARGPGPWQTGAAAPGDELDAWLDPDGLADRRLAAS